VIVGPLQEYEAAAFSACGRAMRFDVRGVDHLRAGRSAVPGKLPEQVFLNSPPSPSYKPVINR
jgi:hypothetical protein